MLRACIPSWPPSAESSGTLGVVSVASCISRSNAAMVSASANAAPLVAIMTGSNTIGTVRASSRSATTAAIAGEPSMPIFTASTPISEIQASICAAISSGESASTAVTPSVFCAVIAVIAVIA